MARKRKISWLLGDRPAYQNVMAVLTLVATASGLVGGAYHLLTRKPLEVVHDNTELIIDRSRAMSEPWEGTTRLEAAESAARNVVGTIATGENLALRQFGGPCQASNTELVVPFAQDNAKPVQNRLARLTAAGDAPLNRAINEAIGDFADQKRFEGANKRILVVTGSDDTCQGAELREAIREKLAADASGAYKIRLDFRFIGIGLHPEQQRNLAELAKITGGRAVFANHPAEVEPLLQSEVHPAAHPEQPQPPKDLSATIDPPAPPGGAARTEGEKVTLRRDVKRLVDTLASGVDHLNTSLANIQKGDFQAARSALAAAERAARNSQTTTLRDAWARGQLPELREASGKCSDLYHKLAAQASEMISLYENKEFDSYRKSADEFQRLAEEFNRARQQVNDLLAHL